MKQNQALFFPQGPPPYAPAPAADPALVQRITKLAEYASRNGPQFVDQVRSKQHGNPEYNFLQGGEGSQFFAWTLYSHFTGQPLTTPQPAAMPSSSQPPPPPSNTIPRAAPALQADTSGDLASLPSEVSSGWGQVLDVLTGSRESIHASQKWFLACAPHAAGMSEMMLQRVLGSSVYERQLHIIYLANDILIKAQQQERQQQPGVPEAFKPRLGRMLKKAYETGGSTPEIQQRLARIVHLWGEKSIFPPSFTEQLVMEMMGIVLPSLPAPNGQGGQVSVEGSQPLPSNSAPAMAIVPPPAPWTTNNSTAPAGNGGNGGLQVNMMHHTQQMTAAVVVPPPSGPPPPGHPSSSSSFGQMHTQQQQQQYFGIPGGAQHAQHYQQNAMTMNMPPPGPGQYHHHHQQQQQQPWQQQQQQQQYFPPMQPPPPYSHSHLPPGPPAPPSYPPPVPFQHPQNMPSTVGGGYFPPGPPYGHDQYQHNQEERFQHMAQAAAVTPHHQQQQVQEVEEEKGPPFDPMSFPPGLIPKLVEERMKTETPYTPLDPTEIEKSDLPPPPNLDAYLKARVDKFYAQLGDYRPGMLFSDIEAEAPRHRHFSDRPPPGPVRPMSDANGAPLDDGSGPAGSGRAGGKARGLGYGGKNEGLGGKGEDGDDTDEFSAYRHIRSQGYHTFMAKAAAGKSRKH